MARVIAISDATYNTLKEIKGARSFGLVIEDLIRENAKFYDITDEHEKRITELEKGIKYGVQPDRETT